MQTRDVKPNRFEAHPKLTLAALVVACLVLGLALAETTLAVLDPQRAGQKRHLTLREWNPGSEWTFAPPDVRVQHASGGAIDHTYSIKVDSEGFIEPSVVHSEPDVEIAFLGGSTTECFYVREKNRFHYVAGRLLERSSGVRINTLNGAKSGNNVMHSNSIFVAKIVPRRVQIAVLMHAVNDLALLRREGTYWSRGEYRLVAASRDGSALGLLRDLRDAVAPRTYRTLRSLLRHETENQAMRQGMDQRPVFGGDGRRALEQFGNALRAFVRTAQAWGVTPVLMTEVLQSQGSRRDAGGEDYREDGRYFGKNALRRVGLNEESLRASLDGFNEAIRVVAASEGAVLIDLAAKRGWTGEDQYDGLHYTDTGSLKVASLVAAELEPIVRRTRKPN